MNFICRVFEITTRDGWDVSIQATDIDAAYLVAVTHNQVAEIGPWVNVATTETLRCGMNHIGDTIHIYPDSYSGKFSRGSENGVIASMPV